MELLARNMKKEHIRLALLHVVPWLALLLVAGCMPRMTVTQTAHYRLYDNLSLPPRDPETWTDTAIPIPKGAIVAFMAGGQIYDPRYQYQMAYTQPHAYLWLKIGKDGSGIPIYRGYMKEPLNINVIKAESDGSLYYRTALRSPESKVGRYTLNVIVWPEDQETFFLVDSEELARSHPERIQYRYLPTFLARLFFTRGDYSKAEALLRSQRESPKPTAHDFILSSRIERSLGRQELARTYAEKALEISRREANATGEILALSDLAWTTSNLGNHKEAIRLAEQALLMAKRLGEQWLIVDRHLDLGGLYLRADNPNEAEKHCKEGRAFIASYGDRRIGPECYLCLGRAQSLSGNQEEAKRSFEAALAAATRWGFSDVLWQARDHLGRIADKQGASREAFTQYAQAINVIEEMRGKLSDSTLKTLFTEGKIGVYERMIYLLIRMQRDAEALEYIERCKGRALLDMLQEKAFSSRNREENELLTEERALAGKIEQISRGLGEGLGGESKEAEDRSAKLSNLQLRRQAVLARIESLNAELASLLTTRPLSTQEIQALLDPDTALLEYFVGEQSARVMLVTRDRVLAFPLAAGPGKLSRLITAFRTDAVEEVYKSGLLLPGYDKALTELHDILIGPATGELRGKRHLVIVPHGVLHYIPFHALIPKKGSYLLESFSVSYLPSASVLRYVRANNKGNHTALFAAANPDTDLTPLPAAEAEAREVAALFETKLLLIGPQATKTSVKRYGGQYDLVLLSTHGEMIESNPLKSNLRFTPSPGDDGKLTVSEIFNLEIKANLVTLSACDTALVLGEQEAFPQGDDLIGLSRAFIHAGTPSIIASLWKVSDDSTVEIMRAFYKNLRKMSKVDALRQAQLTMIKSDAGLKTGSERAWSHPFYWAPFILVGDWR